MTVKKIEEDGKVRYVKTDESGNEIAKLGMVGGPLTGWPYWFYPDGKSVDAELHELSELGLAM
jgi:hypothetical protein|tara:strand:+ start:1638 stop:1826 length:189 start_codon:yes stop_codon:yes gene_type:complete